MTYLPDLHSYLHQSSLLIQAYPTARITTKYSLPRKLTPKQHAKQQQRQQPATSATDPSSTTQVTNPNTREKRDPSATLTLKTFDPESGICLKYRTDKAAEVGRLMSGLGRLAKGEVIEMPSAAPTAVAGDAGDKMVVDEPVAAPVAATANGGGGGGKGGKRRGGKR